MIDPYPEPEFVTWDDPVIDTYPSRDLDIEDDESDEEEPTP